MIVNDPRYATAPGDVPSTESLASVCQRVSTVWEATIAPSLRAGRTVMVVAHGNTLRALVKRLDGVSEDDVFYLDLPTATPLLYEFDDNLGHLARHGLWGDRPTAPRHGRYLVDEARVRAAQFAMRQQCLENLAYSMAPNKAAMAPNSISSVVQTAVTAKAAGRELIEIEGEGYTVRQTPPAYYFQESQRIAQQAQSDLQEFRLSTTTIKVSGHSKRVRCALVLLRHGQSRFNQEKVFTGWADPDLTNRGREEARLAGQMLKATGVKRVDVLFTSVLQRAIKTAWLALDEMDSQWTPVHHSWRLNERNYGDLQGRSKAACIEQYGLKQVQKWRRGYSERPPPWADATRLATVDRRYDAPMRKGADGDGFPSHSESLRDCEQRLLPFLQGELTAAMESAVARAHATADTSGCEYEVPTVLVVASEHVLRGLVMQLEGLSEEEVPLVDVPYAVPLVYQLDSALVPIPTPWADKPLRAGWFLGDPAKVRAAKAEMQAELSPPSGEDSCLVSWTGHEGVVEREWRC